MSMTTELSRRDKLGLIAEWLDPHACIIRRYYFFFYPYDSSVEMYDIKKNRVFLRRTKVQNLSFGDIYVGNIITVFARQLKIVDYANVVTRRLMTQKLMKTFALIKPDGVSKKAEIFRIIQENGFRIANLRMLKFTEAVVRRFLESQASSDSYLGLVTHLQSGPTICLELVGENGVEHLKKLAGPKDPRVARKEAPESIIAQFGVDEVHNTFYYSESAEAAAEEGELIFENAEVLRDPTLHTVVLDNTTCCVIKPHILKEGTFWEIISEIEKGGYTISAMQMFYLDTPKAEEFYEIYKGILLEFKDMVQEIISGPCVALEIVGPEGEEATLHFKKLVGPSDPDMARKLRPNTIRARFGKDRIHNAVHATDLPTDGVLEVEYFFKVLV